MQNNGITYAQMVEKLIKKPQQLHDEITPEKLALIHSTLGVAGEAGEIVDAIKKHAIYNQPLPLENLIEELGDMEFYLEDLRRRLGITREQCLITNMQKLAKRYGPNYEFTDKKAQARADKEVCGFIPPTPGYAACTREKGHTGPCAHPLS